VFIRWGWPRDSTRDAHCFTLTHHWRPGHQPLNPEELERPLLQFAEMHIRSMPFDWNLVFAGSGARRVPLPTYAFQRSRHSH